MNKLLKKIVGAAVGLTMAIGVGFAVGNKSETKTANATATVGTYTKVTGNSLEVGADYLLSYGTRLMGNTVSSNRITNSSTTITNGASSVSNPDDSAVWTLGNRVVNDVTYWTFYNAAVSKYLLGNTSDSKASLNASANDTTACWSLTASNGTFDFTVKGGTRRLRNNASYGWASYTASTGAALTLYKKTTTYTVSFNKNGGSGSMDSVTASGSYTLPDNGFTAPDGKYFAGWKAANAGDTYAAGASYTLTGNVEFYAQWSDPVTLSYDKNDAGASGTTASSNWGAGSQATVASNGFTAPSGKGFAHWSTKPSELTEGNVNYNPGATFTINSDTTLYAQWVDAYTVTYNANGGTGTMTDSNSPYNTGSNVTVLNNGFTAPSGKAFYCWTTAADGSGTKYMPGATISGISDDVELFAQWRKIISFVAASDTGSGSITKSKTTIQSSNGVLNNGSEYRLYSGSTFTVSSTLANIECITFTMNGSYSPSLLSTTTGTYSSATGVWTGSSNSIAFSLSAQARVNSISVVLAKMGTMTNTSAGTTVEKDETITLSTSETGNGGVTYVSANPSVASVVSATGVVTGVAVGSTTITASKFGFEDLEISVTVQSTKPFLQLSSATVVGNTTDDFSVTATYGNLTSDFAWGSPTSEDGGTISGSASTTDARNGTSTYSGKLTGAGTVTLTATGGGVSNQTVTFTITLSSVTITLDKDSVSVQETRKEQVTATVTSTGSFGTDVTWSSDDEGVATVSSTGLITGVAAGSTTVRCTADDDDTVEQTVAVTVTAKIYSKYISITGSNLRSIDTTKGETAYARYDGTADQGDYGLRTFDVALNSSKLQFRKGSGYLNNTTPFNYGISLLKVTTFGTASALYDVKFSTSLDGIETVEGSATKVVVGNDHYWIPTMANAKYFYVVDETTASSNQLKVDAIDVYEYSNAAIEFSTDFVTAMNASDVCGTTEARHDDDNKTKVSALWGTYKGAFEALTTETKSEFGSGTNATIVQARTLYLHCVSRYKLATWTGAPAALRYGIESVNDNNSTLIIVVISMTSLIAVSGYLLFLRKRKEQ